MFATDGWISAPDVFVALYKQNWIDSEGEPVSELVVEKTRSDFRAFVGSIEDAGALHSNGNLFRIGPQLLYRFTFDGRSHELFSITTGLVRSLSRRQKERAWLKTQTRRGRLQYHASKFGTRALMLSSIFLMLFVLVFILFDTIDFLSGSSLTDTSIYFRSFYLSLLGMVVLMVAQMGLSIERYRQARSGPDLDMGRFVGCSVVFKVEDFNAFKNAFQNPNTDEPDEISETRVTELIVKALDRGEQFTRAEMQTRLGNSLSFRSFDRAWSSARSLRPEIGKPGRKRNQ